MLDSSQFKVIDQLNMIDGNDEYRNESIHNR